MQILVVYAHPDRDSFQATILAELMARLAAGGHQLRLLDLYAEDFDPVLAAEDWRAHRQGRPYEAGIEAHTAALREAEGLVFVYPTWWFGLPAILKGWVDRVWQPGLAFAVENNAFKIHYLPKLKRFAAITSYGSPRMVIEWLVGDPARKALMRGLSLQFARGCRKAWAPIYNVDARVPEDLARARDRAVAKVARLFS
jgi:putative NADPH-quinone reductase